MGGELGLRSEFAVTARETGVTGHGGLIIFSNYDTMNNISIAYKYRTQCVLVEFSLVGFVLLLLIGYYDLRATRSRRNP